MYGIFSFSETCASKKRVFGSAGDGIYKFDLDNKTSAFVCEVSFAKPNSGFLGGASTYEYTASGSVSIDTIMLVAPTCNLNNGSVEILAHGGTGILTFSIDGVDYQKGFNFSKLKSGKYTAYVKDSLSKCIATQDIKLISPKLPKLLTTRALRN